MAEGGRPIDPGVDIDRALDFYCGALGFELQQRLGDEAAFVPPLDLRDLLSELDSDGSAS